MYYANHPGSLPQHYGFNPGTSLIGRFGSTEARFSKLPYGADPENPGPGSHNPRHELGGPKWGWGSQKATHQLPISLDSRTPGPGAYGKEQHPSYGGMSSELEKQWPGRKGASAFGSNASRTPLRSSSSLDVPGPGRYNSADSSHFTSGRTCSNASNNPWVGQSRILTGSRLRRDMDRKESFVFSSKITMQTTQVSDGPGPGHYAPLGDSIDARTQTRKRNLLQVAARTSDGLPPTSFDSTAPRFTRDPMSGAPEVDNPGPGAHSVSRWSGEQPSSRRPRSQVVVAAGRCGFLSGSTRFTGAKQQRPLLAPLSHSWSETAHPPPLVSQGAVASRPRMRGTPWSTTSRAAI